MVLRSEGDEVEMAMDGEVRVVMEVILVSLR